MGEKIDWYNTWHFYDEDSPTKTEIEVENPSTWASESEFSWAGDVADLESTLWTEGVVKLGNVSERYLGKSIVLYATTLMHFFDHENMLIQVLGLAGVRAFCTANKYDAVLSLGAERREDSYAAKGSVLGTPWIPWMLRHRYEYGYSSVITGILSRLLNP